MKNLHVFASVGHYYVQIQIILLVIQPDLVGHQHMPVDTGQVLDAVLTVKQRRDRIRTQKIEQVFGLHGGPCAPDLGNFLHHSGCHPQDR